MPISGLRDTEGFLDSQRPRNWREGLILDNPNGMAPLLAMTSLLPSKSTDDPEFNWHEKRFPTQRLQLGADLPVTTDPAVLTIVDLVGAAPSANPELGNGLNVRVGSYLLVEETGEILKVTVASSATAITVAREQGAIGPLVVDFNGDGVNPYLTVIGSEMEEGADTPPAVSFDPVRQWNNTQIFRNSLNMTRTAQVTRLRTGEAKKEAKREAFQLHTTEIERALFWGVRGVADRVGVGGQPVRTTDGVIERIRTLAPSNIITKTAGISLADLEADMELMFRRGSDQKVCFCGNGVPLTIFKILRKNSDSPYQISGGQKEFGFKVTTLQSPFGEIMFKTHPLFNLMTAGENPTTPGNQFPGMLYQGVVMDMADFVWRPLKGADTNFLKNRQGNGEDQSKDEYLTEAGLEIHNAHHHFLWNFNLQPGAADT